MVHLFDVERPDVRPLEPDIIEAGFRPLDEILADTSGFETWSQICLEALFASQIDAEQCNAAASRYSAALSHHAGHQQSGGQQQRNAGPASTSGPGVLRLVVDQARGTSSITSGSVSCSAEATGSVRCETWLGLSSRRATRSSNKPGCVSLSDGSTGRNPSAGATGRHQIVGRDRVAGPGAQAARPLRPRFECACAGSFSIIAAITSMKSSVRSRLNRRGLSGVSSQCRRALSRLGAAGEGHLAGHGVVQRAAQRVDVAGRRSGSSGDVMCSGDR